MSIFEYDEYKTYVNDWVESQPRGGYGVYSRLAEALDTNSVTVSQVFRADRDLSPEQAVKLAKFIGLNSASTDYLLLLVTRARAGSHELRQIYSRQIADLKNRGQALKNRISHEQISEKDRATFYSSWLYLATWLAMTVPDLSSPKKLAARFQSPEALQEEVLAFLLERGLLKRKGSRFEFGKKLIHLPHDSVFVTKHHTNWRLKAMQAMDRRNENDFHYSAPMAMSRKLRNQLREKIVRFIEQQSKDVLESESETLVCLNIDYFDF